MARRARMLVPQDPSAVAVTRDRTMAYVRSWGVPLNDEKREAVKLVVSELVTNAIVHADGCATVGLYYNEDGRLLVVVHDGSSTEPRRRRPSSDAVSGRGLVLVNALSERSGWEPTEGGKKVWAEFDVPVPSPTVRGGVLRRHRPSTTMCGFGAFTPMPLAMAAGL